jgi:serine phosphatase RsbU (regulator of sigma subunit)
VNLTLADVMGKGMPAALLMAAGRTLVRTLAELPPAAMLEAINRVVYPDLVPLDSFITLFQARLDVPSGTLTYADAGHGMAFIRRQNGDVERLTHRGMPLGVLPEVPYSEGEVRLSSGDTLIIYSDGLPDARPELRLDPEGIATQIHGLPDAQAMLECLVDLVHGSPSLPDDLTLVVVRRELEGPKSSYTTPRVLPAASEQFQAPDRASRAHQRQYRLGRGVR